MKVFWFDCETSGLSPKRNGIMQLAYLLEVDGEVEEKGVIYANCNRKEVADKALEITGFRAKEVAEWPAPELMYKELHTMLSRHVDKYDKGDKFIAAGYNVAFDVDFLRQLWFEHGNKYFGSFFAFATIDVAHLFRGFQWFGVEEEGIVKMTLSDLAEYYGIDFDAHDALSDIVVTRDIALRMYEALMATTGGKEKKG